MDRRQALDVLWGAHQPQRRGRWWRRRRCRCGRLLARCDTYRAARRVVRDPYDPATYGGR